MVLLIYHRQPGRIVFIRCAITLKLVIKIRKFYLSKIDFRICLASLLIIVGAGIYRMCIGRVENFAEPFEGSTYGKLTSALYAGLFPYSGW